jgi:hypothetical protein
MSYDIDAEGNKVFYEPEDRDEAMGGKLEFEQWLERQFEGLEQDYIENHPEDFPTEEEMINIHNNGEFQDYCEEKYRQYLMR